MSAHVRGLGKLKDVITRVVMCLAEHSRMHVLTDSMYLFHLTLALLYFFKSTDALVESGCVANGRVKIIVVAFS